MTEAAMDLFAEGLWSRLRDILLAQSRWDGFVHDPEGERSEPPSPKEDEARMAAEMVLRALRVGVDPRNHAILRRLVRENEVPLTALMEQTGLSRVAVIETVNDLNQVGLASYAVESRQVRATPGATGLLGLIDDASSRLARRVRERRTNNAR